mgnify:CR=1 FL=1
MSVGDKMTRHELRDQTFKMLFGMGFHEGEDREAPLYNYLNETCEFELTEEEQKEIVDRVLDISDHLPELDRDIDRVSEGWRISRMGRAELSILRLALYEIRYDDAVPVGVAINEAVELGKEYCSDEAPAFINGVLARLVRETED